MKNRQCMPCTACCDGWVMMKINGVEVYPSHPCPHSTGTGCNAYESRPIDPCINFNCGWIIDGSPLPDWMKPNNARVIVIFSKLTWKGFPVDLAVPVGRRIPPRALNWLQQFAASNSRPMIYAEQILDDGRFIKQQQLAGYGPPLFQQELAKAISEGKKLW